MYSTKTKTIKILSPKNYHADHEDMRDTLEQLQIGIHLPARPFARIQSQPKTLGFCIQCFPFKTMFG